MTTPTEKDVTCAREILRIVLDNVDRDGEIDFPDQCIEKIAEALAEARGEVASELKQAKETAVTLHSLLCESNSEFAKSFEEYEKSMTTPYAKSSPAVNEPEVRKTDEYISRLRQVGPDVHIAMAGGECLYERNTTISECAVKIREQMARSFGQETTVDMSIKAENIDTSAERVLAPDASAVGEKSFEERAKLVLKALFENDKNLQLYMATGRVDYCTNKLASALKFTYAEGQVDSTSPAKAVVKLPKEELETHWFGTISPIHPNQAFQAETREPAKAVVKLPKAAMIFRTLTRTNSGQFARGFNEALIKIRALNPGVEWDEGE